jgi:hypothetical protein
LEPTSALEAMGTRAGDCQETSPRLVRRQSCFGQLASETSFHFRDGREMG